MTTDITNFKNKPLLVNSQSSSTFSVQYKVKKTYKTDSSIKILWNVNIHNWDDGYSVLADHFF